MHIVVAPDKFKGSLTAPEVCRGIARGIRRYDDRAEITSLPLADGGEGSLDLLIPLLELDKVRVIVHDPLLRPVEAYYGRTGDVAYVELAKASGLALLAEEERNALRTTTFGTGELIRHATEQGVREVYLLIGGSATNDAGFGMAQAVGYRFLDSSGTPVSPVGENLGQVAAIESEDGGPYRNEVRVRVISDVDNPLYGPQGAAYVYGPQKGASPEAIARLDQGLRHASSLLSALAGREIATIPGAGAAGGVGAGAMAFLGAELLPGISTIMRLSGASTAIERADLVISGEGKVDEQTLHGKVVRGVGEVCRTHRVPLGVICGTLAANESILHQLGVWRAYAVRDQSMTLAEAMHRAEERIEALAYQLMKDFQRKKSKGFK